MIKNFLKSYALSLVMVLGFTTLGMAQTAPSIKDFPNVKIKNFGQMDERFYRGAQPLEGDYQALKDLGITTIIDLREDAEGYSKTIAESLGMKYYNVPMSGWKYPKDSVVDEFMKIVDNAETGKFFLHCKAGIHRTGVLGAVYRFEKNNWDYDKAYKEMKNYDFSWWMVHGRLKTFVKDYSEEMEEKAKLKAAPPVAAVSGN